MTTPTRFGWSIPLLESGLGYNPGTVTTDPPAEPTDRATLGQAYIPFAPPEDLIIVNHVRIQAASVDPDWSASFTPTLGNVVLVFVFQRSAGSALAPSGWTRLVTIDAASGVTAYAKVSDGTETTMDYDIGTANVRDYIIVEVSGVTLADVETNSNSGTTTAVTTGSVTPTSGVPAIIFGASAVAPDEILGHSHSPGAGWTELYDSVGTGAPFETLIYQIDSSTSGSYNPATTINSMGAGDTWRGITVSLASTADVIYWLDAPLTIDGSDATWESAFADSVVATNGIFWRGTLADSYLIGSAEIRAGFETAGANTITIQGANEADYSDAVTVATIPFTATGSYTLQDISTSWSPTAVYKYWQLVLTTTSDVNVADVDLFDFEATSADQHIADPTDAHDASAISVSPAVNGETDVQGALENHETRIDTLESGGTETPVDHGNMGAAETIDVSAGLVHRGTLDADCTITVTGFTVDEHVEARVKLTQDGTGGWDVTWDADVVFAGDDQPGQTAGDVTWFVLWSDEGDSVIYGAKVGSSAGDPTLGGDLSGTASAAVVEAVQGVAVTDAGTTGDVLTKTGAATATWSTPAAGAGLIPVDVGTVAYDTAGGGVEVEVTTVWGITGTTPYYDAAGAASGEEAVLYFDPATGVYSLVPYDF